MPEANESFLDSTSIAGVHLQTPERERKAAIRTPESRGLTAGSNGSNSSISFNVDLAAQCLGLRPETHELIYPGDAEEHFHAIHRAMSAWAQKVRQRKLALRPVVCFRHVNAGAT